MQRLIILNVEVRVYQLRMTSTFCCSILKMSSWVFSLGQFPSREMTVSSFSFRI